MVKILKYRKKGEILNWKNGNWKNLVIALMVRRILCMEDKKMDYEKEKTYSMGELYKEYKEKYEERNEKRKERGEPVINGVPCSKKTASQFLRELARAVGVYKEFVDPESLEELFHEKSHKIVKSKNKRGNPNWHRYEFTEQEKDRFIRLLDDKENKDVKKCEGLKKDNLEANPDVREDIEQIFIDYLGNHFGCFNSAAFYNCFERHLWEKYKENIYPINGAINKFLESINEQRKLVEDLLSNTFKKVIIEYDKGIYWLVVESLNIISELVSEFAIGFGEFFEKSIEFCKRRQEEGEDIDPEGRQQYIEIIWKLLQAELFRKERKLAEELGEKNIIYIMILKK